MRLPPHTTTTLYVIGTVALAAVALILLSPVASAITFTKLSDPATMPNGDVRDVAWTITSNHLAIAHGTCGGAGPFVSLYSRSGTTLTKVADPATIPVNCALAVAWDPSDTYLAVGHSNTVGASCGGLSCPITVYKRSGDVLSLMTLPNQGTGATQKAAWSPNGTMLAYTTFGANFVNFYTRSGDTFTIAAGVDTAPTVSGGGVAFSPDGQYLTVGAFGTTKLFFYKWDAVDARFEKLADPASLPAAGVPDVEWKADGLAVAVAHEDSPFLSVYTRSGDTFTRVTPTGGNPPSFGEGVAWAPNDITLATAYFGTPFLSAYSFSGGTLTFEGSPADEPPDDGLDADWGAYLAVASEIAGGFSWYDVTDIPVPPTAPEPPTRLVARGRSDHINLSWTAPLDVANLTGYVIYRSPDTNTTFSELATIGTNTSFNDYEVEPGTVYFYCVASTGPGGESACGNEASAYVNTGMFGDEGGLIWGVDGPAPVAAAMLTSVDGLKFFFAVLFTFPEAVLAWMMLRLTGSSIGGAIPLAAGILIFTFIGWVPLSIMLYTATVTAAVILYRGNGGVRS